MSQQNMSPEDVVAKARTGELKLYVTGKNRKLGEIHNNMQQNPTSVKGSISRILRIQTDMIEAQQVYMQRLQLTKVVSDEKIPEMKRKITDLIEKMDKQPANVEHMLDTMSVLIEEQRKIFDAQREVINPHIQEKGLKPIEPLRIAIRRPKISRVDPAPKVFTGDFFLQPNSMNPQQRRSGQVPLACWPALSQHNQQFKHQPSKWMHFVPFFSRHAVNQMKANGQKERPGNMFTRGLAKTAVLTATSLVIPPVSLIILPYVAAKLMQNLNNRNNGNVKRNRVLERFGRRLQEQSSSNYLNPDIARPRVAGHERSSA